MSKNELTIDFVVVAYIVCKNRVLLILHKKLNLWLPVGGHIELKEDPEQAVLREIEEECGLKVKILSSKPKLKRMDTKFLFTPNFLDIHNISKNHKHICFNYFAQTKSDKVKLNNNEHLDIRWFSKKDLDNKKYLSKKNVIFLAKRALKTVKN